jgi:regulator of chromosome condensation
MKISSLKNIEDIACGSSFNLARSSDGIVYSWGIGECGELGRYAPPLKKEAPGNDDGPQYDLPSILQHHLTPGHMFYDQTPSIENSLIDYNDKLKVVKDVKVIGCSSYHSMIVVLGDLVYSCGLNNYGQLGVGDTKNRYYFNEVEALSNQRIIYMEGKSFFLVLLT